MGKPSHLDRIIVKENYNINLKAKSIGFIRMLHKSSDSVKTLLKSRPTWCRFFLQLAVQFITFRVDEEAHDSMKWYKTLFTLFMLFTRHVLSKQIKTIYLRST